MSYQYSIYGVPCRSDRRLTGLSAAPSATSPEIRFHFERRPHSQHAEWTTYFTHELRDHLDRATLEIDFSQSAALYRFRYADGTTFVINESATDVWADWVPPLTLEDTLTYLLGPVMVFVLRLRGALCLHASVVDIDGQAVGFAAPAGGGKSTLAARLAKQGFAVVSDDGLALDWRDGVPYALPGYPRLRLWPDSVASLFGAPDALPLLTPNWDKRFLPLNQNGFAFRDQALPLGAIYYLGEPRIGAGDAAIGPASSQDALMALVANSSQNLLLDPAMRQREFQALGALVSKVPVREVSPQSPSQYLSDFDQDIVSDFRSLRQPAHV